MGCSAALVHQSWCFHFGWRLSGQLEGGFDMISIIMEIVSGCQSNMYLVALNLKCSQFSGKVKSTSGILGLLFQLYVKFLRIAFCTLFVVWYFLSFHCIFCPISSSILYYSLGVKSAFLYEYSKWISQINIFRKPLITFLVILENLSNI